MRHRVKNALALAAGVASQTFRSAETLDEAREVFAGRLASMARAQDLLGIDQQADVDLRRLVDQAGRALQGRRRRRNVRRRGPAGADRRPGATAFSMALHELAHQAVKYGALSASRPIAENPRRGTRRDEIAPGLRALPAGRRGVVALVVDEADRLVLVYAITYGGGDWMGRVRSRS